MKVLTICPSEFLPPVEERTKNHIYFAFDKMKIYLGRDTYSDPFCIVERVPEDPIPAMLYITFDGFVMTSIDDRVIQIAEIEDAEQLNYIKDAGSIYFERAEYRYLDLQTRTIALPYQNGMFQLSVNLSKEIMINEKTVIRFDPVQHRFIIDGEMDYDPEELPYLKKYRGKNTSSVDTTITPEEIQAEVRISPKKDNLIKVFENGLYVNIADKVGSEDFDKLIASYTQYKTMLDGYIRDLQNTVDSIGVNVSETSIRDKISQALRDYKPTIFDILNSYETMQQQLADLEIGSYEMIDERFNEAQQEITDYLDGITSAWEEFPEDEEYYEEQDYMTTTQREVQAMVLNELREQFVFLKPIDPEDSEPIEGSVVIDSED